MSIEHAPQTNQSNFSDVLKRIDDFGWTDEELSRMTDRQRRILLAESLLRYQNQTQTEASRPNAEPAIEDLSQDEASCEFIFTGDIPDDHKSQIEAMLDQGVPSGEAEAENKDSADYVHPSDWIKGNQRSLPLNIERASKYLWNNKLQSVVGISALASSAFLLTGSAELNDSETISTAEAVEYSSDDYLELFKGKFDISSQLELEPDAEQYERTLKLGLDEGGELGRPLNYTFNGVELKLEVSKQAIVDATTNEDGKATVDLSLIETAPFLQVIGRDSDPDLEDVPAEMIDGLSGLIEAFQARAKEMGVSSDLVDDIAAMNDDGDGADAAELSATASVLESAIVDGGSLDARLEEDEAKKAISEFIAAEYPDAEINIVNQFSKPLQLHPAYTEKLQKIDNDLLEFIATETKADRK